MDYGNYIKEVYEEVTALNHDETYKTMLVKHRENGKILVKKEMPLSQGGIYQQIQSVVHPNLIRVREICYTNDKCMVLEDYVSGQTLQELLDEKGSLSYEETMYYLKQILEGLREVHKYHIIHRDLKPENVLISTDQVVKLLDFGIARFQKEGQSKDTTILGTIGYASPEQFGFRQTDVRTDIYAVGILLNKMLTGKMPNEELPSDEKIKEVILKCIEIAPENRYESVEALQIELWGKNRKGFRHIYRGFEDIEGRNGQKQEDMTWLPGFRTDVRWKKVTASIGYGFCVLSTIIFMGDAVKGGIAAVVLEAIALLGYIWLPVMIGTNFLEWDKKIPVLRRLPKELRIGIRVVLCLAVFYLGMQLDGYVRYTILGLPRPN